MSDGYETGELHWQIRNDGRLMFSVMVDDTQGIRHFSEAGAAGGPNSGACSRLLLGTDLGLIQKWPVVSPCCCL